MIRFTDSMDMIRGLSPDSIGDIRPAAPDDAVRGILAIVETKDGRRIKAREPPEAIKGQMKGPKPPDDAPPRRAPAATPDRHAGDLPPTMTGMMAVLAEQVRAIEVRLAAVETEVRERGRH